MEAKIIEFIKSEYDPEVILLGGSRAKGRETEKSDWDLFILGPKKGNGGFVDFEGQHLDITFKNWPEQGKALTIPSGPLWPLKVLLDNSGEKLSKLLKQTEENYHKGPLILYRDLVLDRLGKLESWERKMNRYADNPQVEFWYTGAFYELAIRLWLEFQNKWSLPAAEVLEVIKNDDEKFYNLLTKFLSSDSLHRQEVTQQIFKRVEGLYTQAKS